MKLKKIIPVFVFCTFAFFVLSSSSFTTNPCINPYDCWDFADTTQDMWGSDLGAPILTASEEYAMWEWLFDYCIDGLYAPVIPVNCL